MNKIDLKKEIKEAFSAKSAPGLVTIPPISYITFPGAGDPNSSPDFQYAMPVLYGLAYTLKFTMKEEEKDFVVAPLEGQWWADDMNAFHEGRKEEWIWKLMIAVPDYITETAFLSAQAKLKEKKNPPRLEKARLEMIEDGISVQALHLGPYSQEAATIAAMHHFAEQQGYTLHGKHREIYLSDPRRTLPEKLKTIIRQPLMRN